MIPIVVKLVFTVDDVTKILARVDLSISAETHRNKRHIIRRRD